MSQGTTSGSNQQSNDEDGKKPAESLHKKFLFVSLESLSGDLAWALAKEGHEVKLYIKSKKDQEVYDGFFEKVPDWKEYIDWADVIVFDDVGFGQDADRLRKQGKKVVGGSVYTDQLEIDREFGQQELKKYKINILPSSQFTSIEEAINFIKENPQRYVFKPSWNTTSEEKGILYISQEEDGRDLLQWLEKNQSVLKKKNPVFLLQRYITGVEIAVGAFFNGKNFIYPININFEHKRVFPGDIGPFSGEMGTTMYWSEPNTLFRSTLEKMLPALQESGYIGYVDINCMVNGRGIYPLEFTTRFGYPTISIQLEGITTPTGEWLSELANGEDFSLKTKRGFQIGVCIMVPTALVPDSAKKVTQAYQDLAILFKNPNLEGVHIEDVKNDNGVWRIAGDSGSVIIITAHGTTMEEARHLVYTRIQNIIIPNMFYRNDIGTRWFSDSDKLHTWGYLR